MSPIDGSSPGQTWRPRCSRERRPERDDRDRDDHRRRDRQAERSHPSGSRAARPSASGFTCSASVAVDQQQRDERRRRPAHEQRARVGPAKRRVTERAEPAEAEQHHDDPARRQRREREHAEQRGRAHRRARRPRAACPTRLAAIAPTAAERDRDGHRDDPPRRSPRPQPLGASGSAARALTRHHDRPASRAAERRPGRRAARASRRPRSRWSTTRADTGPLASPVQHHTAPPAASVARPMPAARLAMRSTSSSVPFEIDHERDTDDAGRLVLAHDERAPPRARGPVHEPGGVAGHVRAHRSDRVTERRESAVDVTAMAPSCRRS